MEAEGAVVYVAKRKSRFTERLYVDPIIRMTGVEC